MKNKKGDLLDSELVKWAIGLGVLVLIFIIYGILSGKMGGAISYFKNMFSGGGVA